MLKLIHRGWPPAVLTFGLIATLAWIVLFGFGLFKLAEFIPFWDRSEIGDGKSLKGRDWPSAGAPLFRGWIATPAVDEASIQREGVAHRRKLIAKLLERCRPV